jgi:hypothetical protein
MHTLQCLSCWFIALATINYSLFTYVCQNKLSWLNDSMKHKKVFYGKQIFLNFRDKIIFAINLLDKVCLK